MTDHAASLMLTFFGRFFNFSACLAVARSRRSSRSFSFVHLEAAASRTFSIASQTSGGSAALVLPVSV